MHHVSSLKVLVIIIVLTFCGNASYAQPYNQKLIAQLAEIAKTDQQYRDVPVNTAGKKYGWNSPQVTELMHKQDALDIANLAKVEKMIAQYGYPGKTLVGEKYMSTAFMVIQHNDHEVQIKYLPLLTEAANKGELNWSSLALMIDRVKTGNGEKQVYGSQLHDYNNIRQLYPIEDEANVNVRRAKIGLAPLQDYLKTFNIVYQVPTGSVNPNPVSLYVNQTQKHESPVELIGGDDALYGKLAYPEEAKKNNVSGSVTVELTIDKDGNTKGLSVVKGLGHGCDEEALRVMKDAKFTNTTGGDHDIRMKLPFPYKKD
jgi:TonB family protein